MLRELSESGTLSGEEVEEGFIYFMEFLEDSAIDIPASPKVRDRCDAFGHSESGGLMELASGATRMMMMR